MATTNVDSANLKNYFKAWARFGYGARGVVYLLIGGLAMGTVFNLGGKTTDSKGALLTLLSQPFGEILLGVMIVSLGGYSAWRLIQATKDPDDHGTSLKGIIVRLSLFASALTHIALAFWATKLLLGIIDEKNGSGDFLANTFGRWFFMGVGIIFIGVGVAHAYKGWTARFERYMEFPSHHQLWARAVSRIGLVARGVVWAIVGWFFIKSAYVAQQGKVSGVADALKALETSAYGPWLLGVVAIGLVAFDVYSLLEAAYRRINITSANSDAWQFSG